MDNVDPSTAAYLSAARRDLQKRGSGEHAELVTAVWEVYCGGCGFDLTKGERDMACEVARLLFCDAGSVSMMLKQAAGRIGDGILRGEIRRIASGIEGR